MMLCLLCFERLCSLPLGKTIAPLIQSVKYRLNQARRLYVDFLKERRYRIELNNLLDSIIKSNLIVSFNININNGSVFLTSFG
jgi:hypothetical protein